MFVFTNLCTILRTRIDDVVEVDKHSFIHHFSEETGQASASHHAHHGLRAATLPAEDRHRYSGPGSAMHEAIVERGVEVDER